MRLPPRFGCSPNTCVADSGLPLPSAVRLASPSQPPNFSCEATPRSVGGGASKILQECSGKPRLTALGSGKPQTTASLFWGIQSQ
jgi:hypothetical protein